MTDPLRVHSTDDESTGNAAPAGGESAGFTEAERAAMKERAREVKAARRKKSAADGEADVLAKIEELHGPERDLARRLHEVIRTNAPMLAPKTWYGMPAYARDGKIVCFFQSASKFRTRYATLGFSDEARLDDGNLWPVAFALKELTTVEEAQIVALLKQAMGGDA